MRNALPGKARSTAGMTSTGIEFIYCNTVMWASRINYCITIKKFLKIYCRTINSKCRSFAGLTEAI